MADCPSLTLTVPEAPQVSLVVAEAPVLSFYAATQVPGEVIPLTASEDLAASSFVSITPGGLVAAAAYPPRPAHAFIRTAALSGSQVYVNTNGILTHLSGLLVGENYWLGTPGTITPVVPFSGIAQRVGTAVSSSLLVVQIEPPVYLE